MEKIDKHTRERFFEAILTLKTKEECVKFFDDICTIKELEDMSQRLQVAEMLAMNKNYQEISKETGASSATISRVNRCYVYGLGGYKEIIEKLSKKEEL